MIHQLFALSGILVVSTWLTIVLPPLVADAQNTASTNQKPTADQTSADDSASIKGTLEFDSNFNQSWKGTDLVVELPEIKTKLFEQVQLDPIPFPENWSQLKPEEQQAWAKSFEESEQGKSFIAEREKRIAAAKDFDVLIEKDGKFVIYDVPVGVYGLRGRLDRQFDGTTYGFEVFAQIDVIKGMNEVRLPPIQVAITPMLKAGETAPPIAVKTHDGKNTIGLDSFNDSFVLVSYWITNSPSAAFQTSVQDAFAKVREKHPIRLLSVCVDENPAKAIKFIAEKQLTLGSHGFTGGFVNRTMFDYGVRAIPSFWLISPDGKISMSQYDFAMAFRSRNDLAQIIIDQIEGNDVPPANNAPTTDASRQQK
jgi:hypothetical protein